MECEEQKVLPLQKKYELRLTLDGRTVEFDNINELADYLVDNWKETSYAGFIKYHFKNIVTENGFGLNRGINNGKLEGDQ